MNTKAHLNSYEDIEFSITINAPVKEWRDISKQLEELKRPHHIGWPLNRFADCINKMLYNLDKTHTDVLNKGE